MALKTQDIPRPTWELFCGSWVVGGDRDALILGSTGGDSEDPDVSFRFDAELTEDDRRKLSNQGVPEECCDDLSIFRARAKLDKTYHLVGEEVSKPGRELDRSYVLGKVEDLMKRSDKPGALIYYFGHSKKNTGDWCFKDGYITFKDLMSMYMNHFSGRVLTIVTDCNFSGSWVRDCMQYLDEIGVTPCGHSGVKNNVLVKVFASCRPTEWAATPCFSVRGIINDKNTGLLSYLLKSQLRKEQSSYGCTSAMLLCGKKIDEPCVLESDYTWQRKSEGERLFLVRGSDRGRPAWHYVVLVDDDEAIKKFKERTQGSNAGKNTLNLQDYGQVVKSGWGEDPPNEIVDEIERKYNADYS